jgi:hypothetical protein
MPVNHVNCVYNEIHRKMELPNVVVGEFRDLHVYANRGCPSHPQARDVKQNRHRRMLVVNGSLTDWGIRSARTSSTLSAITARTNARYARSAILWMANARHALELAHRCSLSSQVAHVRVLYMLACLWPAAQRNTVMF